MRGTSLTVYPLILAALCSVAVGQSFQPLQSPLGISGAPPTAGGLGCGVCIADFDGDHDMDVVIAEPAGGQFRFYRNQGGMVFVDESATSGLGICAETRCYVAGDIDNDGDTDLYVGNDNSQAHLFINDGTGFFVDEASLWGLLHADSNYAAGFGDYDRDGLIDLYVGMRTNAITGFNERNLLYHNEGGLFVEVGATAGVDDIRPALVTVFMDYNEDGWPDILIANDKGNQWGPNELYENNKDGTFTAVGALTGTNIAVDGMGVDFLDVFNDGGVDFYCSDLPPDHLFQPWDPVTQTYLNATATFGLTGGGVGWAVNWLDYDNDGWQDLHVVQADDGNLLYRNPAMPFSAQQPWTEVAPSVAADMQFRQMVAATADFNDDGKIDLLERFHQGPAPVTAPDGILVLQNAVPGGNWIKFDAEGTVSNRDGFGARFEVRTGNHLQRQWVRSGIGYMSSSDPRLHFGLGAATMVDQVKITWPSGQVQYLTDLAANQIVEVLEPKISLAAPATVGGTTSLNMSIPGDEGLVYLMVLSFSNVSTPLLPGLELPIQIDALTDFTLVPGNGILPGSIGLLDAAGSASSFLNIPPLPVLSGLTFYATGVTIDAPTFPFLRTVFPAALPITIQ